MNSDIYINGELVGNHPYGYTGFAFDITDLVRTDGTPNLVAVVVKNRLPSSRWYSGSGIYRNVRLVATEPVHVARFGTTVTTPDAAATVGAGHVNVHVATDVVNQGGEEQDVEVCHEIRDPRGHVVVRSTSSIAVAPGTAHQSRLCACRTRRCGRSPRRSCTRSRPPCAPTTGGSTRSTRRSACAGSSSIRPRACRSMASTRRSAASTSTTTSERWAPRSTATACCAR